VPYLMLGSFCPITDTDHADDIAAPDDDPQRLTRTLEKIDVGGKHRIGF